LDIDLGYLRKNLPAERLVSKKGRTYEVRLRQEARFIYNYLSEEVEKQLRKAKNELRVASAVSTQRTEAQEIARIRLLRSLKSLVQAEQQLITHSLNGQSTERYSSAIQQQQLLKLQNLKTFNFRWSSSTVGVWTWISEQDLERVDEELSRQIEIFLDQAAINAQQGSMFLAIQSYYKAYLYSLMAYERLELPDYFSVHTPSEVADRIQNAYQDLVQKHINLRFEQPYLLNEQTVASYLHISTAEIEQVSMYVSYTDHGEDIVQLSGPEALPLTFIQPLSPEPDYPVQLRLSPSLASDYTSDPALEALEAKHKLWVKLTAKVPFKSIQPMDIELQSLSESNMLEIRPKLPFVDIQSVQWTIGEMEVNEAVLPLNKLHLKQHNRLRLQINQQPAWTAVFEIDPVTYTVKRLEPFENDTTHQPQITEQEHLEKAATFSRPMISTEVEAALKRLMKIKDMGLLMQVLSSYERAGWRIGNIENRPSASPHILIVADKSSIQQLFWVDKGSYYNTELDPKPSPNIDISETNLLLIWLQKEDL
jgi:hypothetical protein